MKKMLYLVGIIVTMLIGNEGVYANTKANLSLVGPTVVKPGEVFSVLLRLDNFEHEDGVAAVGGRYIIDEEKVEIVDTESLAIFNIGYNKKIMCGYSMSLDTRINEQRTDLFKLVLRVRRDIDDEEIVIGTEEIEISAGNPKADILPANNPSITIKIDREEEKIEEVVLEEKTKEQFELENSISSKVEEIDATLEEEKKEKENVNYPLISELMENTQILDKTQNIGPEKKLAITKNDLDKKNKTVKNKVKSENIKKIDKKLENEKEEIDMVVNKMINILDSLLIILKVDNTALGFSELPQIMRDLIRL